MVTPSSRPTTGSPARTASPRRRSATMPTGGASSGRWTTRRSPSSAASATRPTPMSAAATVWCCRPRPPASSAAPMAGGGTRPRRRLTRRCAWRRPAAASSQCPAGGGVRPLPGSRLRRIPPGAGRIGAHLGSGVPVFSGLAEDRPATALLAAHGLVAAAPEILDREAEVTFTRWHRPAQPQGPA